MKREFNNENIYHCKRQYQKHKTRGNISALLRVCVWCETQGSV